jgi:DNA (cytosine-5)-methyltransferase 1
MKHLDLFSGIGGFAYAADQVWDDVEHTFCDNDPFCQEIIKKHWPNSPIYGDIRQLTTHTDSERELQPQGSKQEFREWVGDGVDLLTGGFPCQPFSAAGRRRGTEDNRFLWPEMLRVIQEFQPTWVIAENVRGLLTIDNGMVFEQVCLDLEASGYEVQPFIIPACAVNAPHRRDRIWFVAHTTSERRGTEPRDVSQANELEASERQEERDAKSGSANISDATHSRCEHGSEGSGKGVAGETSKWSSTTEETQRHERIDWERNWHEIATALCRVDDGIPRRLDRTPRLKALGNAIVPQVAEEIMRALQDSSR